MAYKKVPNDDYQSWFMGLIKDKPFNQKTLLDLEPTLNEYGVQLTPPNAAGDRTKIGIPRAGGQEWVRVGFGEGVPVWKSQGTMAYATGASFDNPLGSNATGQPRTTPNGDTVLGHDANTRYDSKAVGASPAPGVINVFDANKGGLTTMNLGNAETAAKYAATQGKGDPNAYALTPAQWEALTPGQKNSVPKPVGSSDIPGVPNQSQEYADAYAAAQKRRARAQGGGRQGTILGGFSGGQTQTRSATLLGY